MNYLVAILSLRRGRNQLFEKAERAHVRTIATKKSSVTHVGMYVRTSYPRYARSRPLLSRGKTKNYLVPMRPKDKQGSKTATTTVFDTN